MRERLLSEQDIKNSILDWLATQRQCIAWVTDSIGIWDPTKQIYRKRRGKHARLGVSDIIACWNGQLLAIEVKSEKGRLSPEQKIFFEDITRVGGRVMLARSIDDVIRNLKYWELL